MSGIRLGNIESRHLVTGVIRSGTTFVGKVLSLPWSVDYIHEPFAGGYSLPDRRLFSPDYVRIGNGERSERHRAHVAHLFRYDFGLSTMRDHRDFRHMKIVKHIVGSRGPVYLQLAKLNPIHRAVVIKDPLAKLQAEYLYREFGVRPVIVVRHPVSLAASLQRVGWYPEVKDFASQPELVEDYFSGDATFLQRAWSSRLLEAMGHWRATYKVLLAQAERYSDWQVVTHEALSADPLAEFERLYNTLQLPWSPRIARKVQRMTGGRNSAEATGGQAMDLKRDSARIFEMRRDAIPEETRQAIFEIVSDVALRLYPRESFAID
jgi:hypothetical protein